MSQCCMPRAQGGPRSSCSQPGLAAAPGHSHEGFHAQGAKPGPGSILCSLWFFSVRCKDLGGEDEEWGG